ncbi:MAG: OmpA family protein [Pseudomonadota bacterium]
MTESEPYPDVQQYESTRRYIRRRGPAGALFFPLGLIPALGLVLLTLFALYPFAHNAIEHHTERAAMTALQDGEETWASVRASGQWITVEGQAPTRERAERAISLIRGARAGTLFGAARPVTRIRDLTTLDAETPSAPAEADPSEDPEATREAPDPTPASSTPPAQASSPADCNARLARILEETEFFFASGSADVGTQNAELLDQLTEELRVCPGSILIAGHTDSTGSDSTNQFLSRARAEAIRDALTARGVLRDRVSARGFGSSQPVATNTTADGRARNRRIEIEISASGTD